VKALAILGNAINQYLGQPTVHPTSFCSPQRTEIIGRDTRLISYGEVWAKVVVHKCLPEVCCYSNDRIISIREVDSDTLKFVTRIHYNQLMHTFEFYNNSVLLLSVGLSDCVLMTYLFNVLTGKRELFNNLAGGTVKIEMIGLQR
jgi:hypothetical protein